MSLNARALSYAVLLWTLPGCPSDADLDGGPLDDTPSATDAGRDAATALDADAAPPELDAPAGLDAPMDDAPSCEPPGMSWVGDRCLPSCGGTGGNTCVGTDSTLCEGLSLLESYDCAVCCNRPTYPGPVGLRSFHFVYEGDEAYWDGILDLGTRVPNVAYVAVTRPDEIPLDRWVMSQHTSTQPTGADMARRINEVLVNADTAPLMVMIDELNDGTVGYIDELARTMNDRYRQWEGRWGVFSTIFTSGQPAIDNLLLAHAHIASERYFRRQDYCDSGSNGGERDISLARFFDGDGTLARYHWLTERRGDMSSRSPLSVLFGVTDRYMTGTAPAVFLDRMFYVWATRTRHPEVVDLGGGSVGAWKWTPRHVAGGFGTSNTSRDTAFAASVEWYGSGMRTSRLGPVDCP